MQTISEMYQQSLLAMAAYADLKLEGSGNKDALEDAGFSKSQASQFLAKYEVLSPYSDAINGYSGTLFRVKTGGSAGQTVFALRGTDFNFSGGLQDIVANISLGLRGVATEQVMEMINHYLRAITPTNEEAPQYRVVPGLVTGEVTTSVVQKESVMGLEILSAPSPITVVGHSLGGHLAQAFVRLFPTVISDAYTYNGAGLNAGIGSGFDDLE